MTPRDFCYWLQGYFELQEETLLTRRQVEEIKRHLGLVFNQSPPLQSKTIKDGTSEYTEVYDNSVSVNLPIPSCYLPPYKFTAQLVLDKPNKNGDVFSKGSFEHGCHCVPNCNGVCKHVIQSGDIICSDPNGIDIYGNNGSWQPSRWPQYYYDDSGKPVMFRNPLGNDGPLPPASC